ncbi:hypothetical protein WG622_17195 [Cognatishimia sp. D5M38]|uniref:Sel1 repeat family protein n=1 Tax=Cognatishimia coralii TaxID=3083254 RepID=A0ABU8QKP1_9RHOB
MQICDCAKAFSLKSAKSTFVLPLLVVIVLLNSNQVSAAAGRDPVVQECVELANPPAPHYLFPTLPAEISEQFGPPEELSIEQETHLIKTCQSALAKFPLHPEVMAVTAWAEARVLGIDLLEQAYKARMIAPLKLEPTTKLKQSVAAGSVFGKTAFGLALIRGKLLGEYLTKDLKLGRTMIEQAAESGYPWAQVKLSRLHYQRKLNDSNVEAALKYAKAAAENEYPLGNLLLGSYYFHGIFPLLDENEPLGLEYMRKASSQGVVGAQRFLERQGK